jgi:AGZA family xanthine/uracil permease-like MFS transporter
MSKLAASIDKYFRIEERSTTIPTEIMAGLVTFMTTAYVFVVHPGIMAGAGLPVGPMVVITALIGGLATLFMAFYANMPFALLPGMGSNALFAFSLVATGTVTWQVGLGMVFISGVIFILLTVLGIRDLIVKMIPKGLKLAVPAAVGLFITQLGFSNAGLLDFSGANLLTMGDVHTPQVALALITFLIIIALKGYKVRGAILYSLLLGTIIGIPMGVTIVPETFFAAPPSISEIAFKLDILGALKFAYIPVIFTFFFSDFFSTLGTLIGVGGKAGLLDEDGNLPDINKPFLVDAVATLVGSVLGTTVVTTYVESAAGVEAGGRTGLTALTTSICYFLMLLFTPIVMMIPAAVTAPALVIIGLLMLSTLQNLDFNDFTELLPAFVTIVFTAYTFNLATGISAGILSYVFLKTVTLKHKELHWGLYILCIPLVYYFISL